MTQDPKAKRAHWHKARAAESSYNTKLRAVAKQVQQIIKSMTLHGSVVNAAELLKVLTDYAKTIEPWAGAVARMMLADVARRDLAMWRRVGKDMSVRLRQEIAQAPVGDILRVLQDEQVKLIKSIPLEAAEKVHEMTLEGLTTTSVRAAETAKRIQEIADIPMWRARLIARTETSRVASNLVQARASWAGSDGYIWRTSMDSDVRPSHRRMEGKYVRWGHPPTLDKLKGHAGTLPNCRCFAEPMFPEL